jgi:hypothetical protein
MKLKFDSRKIVKRQKDGSLKIDAKGDLELAYAINDAYRDCHGVVHVKTDVWFLRDGKKIGEAEGMPWMKIGDSVGLQMKMPFVINFE